MSQYDAGGFNPYEPPGADPPRTSLLAVSGFVSSVIFCCPLTSLIGLLLGVAGLVSVSSSNGRRKGTGLAAAAIIIALVSLLGQAFMAQKFSPYFQSWVRVGLLIATGPQPLIDDLTLGDLQSARSHLYPTLDAQITDAQLQYFADEVTARYGSAMQWVPPQNPPFNPSAPGEQSFDISGQVRFSRKTCNVTMELRVLLSNAGQFEKSGIARLVIEDPDLGDLVLDENTPAAQIPGESPGTAEDGEAVEPPAEGEGGNEPEDDGG